VQIEKCKIKISLFPFLEGVWGNIMKCRKPPAEGLGVSPKTGGFRGLRESISTTKGAKIEI
jgi:hypothetical protein